MANEKEREENRATRRNWNARNESSSVVNGDQTVVQPYNGAEMFLLGAVPAADRPLSSRTWYI
jgi:hypothetical protein